MQMQMQKEKEGKGEINGKYENGVGNKFNFCTSYFVVVVVRSSCAFFVFIRYYT